MRGEAKNLLCPSVMTLLFFSRSFSMHSICFLFVVRNILLTNYHNSVEILVYFGIYLACEAFSGISSQSISLGETLSFSLGLQIT